MIEVHSETTAGLVFGLYCVSWWACLILMLITEYVKNDGEGLRKFNQFVGWYCGAPFLLLGAVATCWVWIPVWAIKICVHFSKPVDQAGDLLDELGLYFIRPPPPRDPAADAARRDRMANIELNIQREIQGIRYARNHPRCDPRPVPSEPEDYHYQHWDDR